MPKYRCRSGSFRRSVDAAGPEEALSLAAGLLREGDGVSLFMEVTGPGAPAPMVASTAFLVRRAGGMLAANLVAEVPREANDACLAWLLGFLPGPGCWGDVREAELEGMLETVRGNLRVIGRTLPGSPSGGRVRLMADRLKGRPMMEVAAGLDLGPAARPGPALAGVLALLEAASAAGASDRDVILAAWAAECFATAAARASRRA